MDINYVYLGLIIAAGVVIVGVVWVLRDRITGASGEVDLDKRKAKGSFKAAAPGQKQSPLPPARGSSASVDISGNTLVGSNTIRVWRDKTRVAYNRLLGKNTVEVKPDAPPVQAAGRRKRKK